MDVDSAILLARIFFWILCVSMLFVRLRWAFLCLIVASHLDITNISFTSASAIGFENAVRVLVLPSVLLVRMHYSPLKNLVWGFPQKVWMALIAYAAVATLWSDFRLSGLKMVTYLMMYFVLYAIFLKAWETALIDVKLVRTSTLIVIGLAFIQTFAMGNTSGVEDRLTTFSTPQYFAAFLLATLAVLVFSEERGLFHYASCLAVVVAIVLSGSRYIFVSMILLFGFSSLRSAVGERRARVFKLISKRLVATFAVIFLGLGTLVSYFPSGRIDDFLQTFVVRNASIEDVGTWAWRLKIYTEIMSQLSQRSARQLFFGSGTSSGAALMLDLEPQLYSETGVEGVDGNRVLHSEFLRTLYEWGVPGIALLCIFLISIGVAFIRRIMSDGGVASLAFVGVFPSILFGLSIENILAGAVSAAGIGIVLSMTYAWQDVPDSVRQEHRAEDLVIGKSDLRARA